jgi:hypothetical protein
MSTPITEEQQKQINDFIKAYGELVKLHKVDFLSYPMFQPDGNGNWTVVVQTQAVLSKEEEGIKSPFVAQP